MRDVQRISIQHVGPIRSFTSDILKMNLLIGEQATGKSTICKSVYFFWMIKDEIITYLYNIAASIPMPRNTFGIVRV